MIDVFIVVVIVLSALWGYLRGFLYDLLGLAALIVAWVGSEPLAVPVGRIIAPHTSLSAGATYVVARLIGGVAIYASLKVVTTVVDRHWGKTKEGGARRWNRNLGAMAGLVSGVVTALLLLILADSFVKAYPEREGVLIDAVRRSGLRQQVTTRNPADRYFVTDALRLIRAQREDPELARRMGENGIRRAREMFAMDAVVDRYLEVYASCP